MSSSDIVIVGAGVVGLTVALALAKKTNLQITIIESAKLSTFNDLTPYDLRVSAISLASQRIFQRLNVWDAIYNKRISPYKKMYVWDENSKSKLEFDCGTIFTKQLGWIIEDNILRACLLEAISQQRNIKLYSEVKLISLRRDGESITIKDEKNTWNAKLIIAADGANSWVRSAAGMTYKEKDYTQKALVATVESEFPHQQTAYQRFLKEGVLAFLPLSGSHQSSIVWSLNNETAERINELDETDFKKILAESFSHLLGKITQVSERKLLPLALRQADSYVQANIALVGDAAHTIHPLAGQGVNLGLLDAACLVDVIADALSKQRDYASFATLRKYERNRKTENTMMLNFVDNIKKIFATQSKSINVLKEYSFKTVNQYNFIKKIFITHAVGNQSMATLTKP